MSRLELNTNNMLELSKKFAKNLSKMGFSIQPKNIISCELFDSINTLGYTEVLDKHKYCIHFNKKLCKEGKDEYRKNVIYHELAHIIQYNETFAIGAIIMDRELGGTKAVLGKENIAINAAYYNDGHTMLWRQLVKEIQEKIDFIIPIKEYADAKTLEKMLEELFVRTARNYINEKGNFVHVDYSISGLTVADIDKYSDKKPIRIEDLCEALAKEDFYDVPPITPPGYKGPNATKYFIEKFIDENGNWRDPDGEE